MLRMETWENVQAAAHLGWGLERGRLSYRHLCRHYGCSRVPCTHKRKEEARVGGFRSPANPLSAQWENVKDQDAPTNGKTIGRNIPRRDGDGTDRGEAASAAYFRMPRGGETNGKASTNGMKKPRQWVSPPKPWCCNFSGDYQAMLLWKRAPRYP